MTAEDPIENGILMPSNVTPSRFSFRAIGSVGPAQGDQLPVDTIREVSLLILRPELVPGLDGLTPGDHVMVIFVFDRAGECELRQHPRGDRQRARRGVFSLRSPRRPNPIGVTVVEVLEIVGNIVRVQGLDAWPGTPILDLKPVGNKNKGVAL